MYVSGSAFFGLDVIHGHETVFPVPLGLSTSWNMDLIEHSARIAAREMAATGINWVFSPMVDICRDARWGRIVEGGGEDPYLGGEIAKAMVYGYQGRDESFDTDEVLTCVKHYALYGGAESGRDYNSVFLSRQEALNGYMRPYQAAAEAGAASYMSSFNEFEGIPASMNHYLMQELLRDAWGFKGFIMTDWDGDSDRIEDLQAGNDIIMGGYTTDVFAAAMNGKKPEFNQDGSVKQKKIAMYGGAMSKMVDLYNAFTIDAQGPDRIEVPFNETVSEKVRELQKQGICEVDEDRKIVIYKGYDRSYCLKRSVLQRNAMRVLNYLAYGAPMKMAKRK